MEAVKRTLAVLDLEIENAHLVGDVERMLKASARREEILAEYARSN